MPNNGFMSDDQLWDLIRKLQKHEPSNWDRVFSPTKAGSPPELIVEQLHIQIHPQIMALVRQNFSNATAQDHEDIVQLTEVAFFRSIPKLTQRAKVMTIIGSFARNKFIDIIRSKPKAGHVHWSDEIQKQIEADYIPDPWRSEKLELLKEMLKRLDEEERDLYILRAWKEWSFEEIAKELVYPSANAARVAFDRCKKRADKILKKLLNEGEN